MQQYSLNLSQIKKLGELNKKFTELSKSASRKGKVASIEAQYFYTR